MLVLDSDVMIEVGDSPPEVGPLDVDSGLVEMLVWLVPLSSGREVGCTKEELGPSDVYEELDDPFSGSWVEAEAPEVIVELPPTCELSPAEVGDALLWEETEEP
jgi:hypothetical protein